jgi:hypothetical protein
MPPGTGSTRPAAGKKGKEMTIRKGDRVAYSVTVREAPHSFDTKTITRYGTVTTTWETGREQGPRVRIAVENWQRGTSKYVERFARDVAEVRATPGGVDFQRLRDAQVRVYDQIADDASDMYVMEVFGVTVRVYKRASGELVLVAETESYPLDTDICGTQATYE